MAGNPVGKTCRSGSPVLRFVAVARPPPSCGQHQADTWEDPCTRLLRYGDGILDLAGVSGFGASVFLGNGDGTFQPEVEYASESPYNLAVADFSLDGKPDLAIGDNTNSGTFLAVRYNNGDGTFGPEDDYIVGLSGGTVVGDFNHDGFPDLATLWPNETSVSPLTLLLNTGKSLR